MTPEHVIALYEYKYREHLEMYEEPDKLLIRILANQIVKLEDENVYLKRRIKSEVLDE